MNQDATKEITKPDVQLRVIAAAPTFSLVPKDLGQAMELAKIIADSDLAPKDYRGKHGNVLIAVQMGAEVGLSPMASIQSIAVINGKPSLYGDVGKAILLSNGFVIEEDDTETIKKQGFASCKITRKGRPPCVRTFSLENAKVAGLAGKAGPWSTYPERQMAWRAFWFAARDIAADVLKGLSGAEEVIDYIDITPKNESINAVTGEITGKREEKKPEPIPQVEFDKQKAKFQASIVTGKKTHQAVIAWINAQGLGYLTEAMLVEINSWPAPKPAENMDAGPVSKAIDPDDIPFN